MDVREKLVELLTDDYCPLLYMQGDVGNLADYLIKRGVTVQDGKPLEEFLHPIDAYKGLKAKYLVFKADTGKVVDNCFILRPDKDAAAVEALRAYANTTDNKTLAEDIYNWVGKGVTLQERRMIMTTCKQCRAFEKCKDDAFINGAKFDPNESVKYCTGFEPITNADRILAMSDEELAKFCNSGFHCLICSEGDKGEKGVCDVKCDEHCLEWLKQPAEKSDTLPVADK